MKCPRIRITLRTNIILTKILLTNAHRKHLTTLPHTMHTNAASADLNPLLALGKSVRVVMNQNVKSVINVANLTVGVNVKVVNDTVDVNDTANRIPSPIVSRIVSRIASANAKRNAVSAEKRKRLFTTIVENALSSKYVLANSILQPYVQIYNLVH